jgi:hypothetical protein
MGMVRCEVTKRTRVVAPAFAAAFGRESASSLAEAQHP